MSAARSKSWPTFGRVLLSLLAIDAGVFALVWLAWQLTGY